MENESSLFNQDKQIILVVQSLTNHILNSREHNEEICISGLAGEWCVQIELTDELIRIIVFHNINKTLHALVSYDKTTAEPGLHHRGSLLNKYIIDLIVLNHMRII